MDGSNNVNYQPSIIDGANTRPYMPNFGFNGQTSGSPMSTDKFPPGPGPRPSFDGGFNPTRAPFQNYAVRPPLGMMPPGKPGEPIGPVQPLNPAAMPAAPNAWRGNVNGVSSTGPLVGVPSVIGYQQPIGNFGRPPVPSSFQGPPMVGGGPMAGASMGPVPPVTSLPSASGPWVQQATGTAPAVVQPLPVASPGARPVGPPPRAGVPYQPAANLPPPPPMMVRPPQMRAVNSPPSYNDSGASMLPPPGRPSELPVPFDGHGQYSHQVHAAPTPGDSSQSLTPSGSQPPSQRSSRVPTPVNVAQNFDNLEGQFSPNYGSASNAGQPTTMMYTSPASGSQIRPPSEFPVPSGAAPSYQQEQRNQVQNAYSSPGVRPPLPPPQGSGMVPTYQQPQFSQQALSQGPNAGAMPPSYLQPADSMKGSFRPPAPGQFGPTSGNNHANYPGMLSNSFGAMNLQPDYSRPLNLMQERHILPTEGIETVLPNLPNEFKKANCSPDVMSCTINTIPSTQSLLKKSGLPLGILIHPFKDLSQLPVIQSSVIVRCRSCRTYINPFVTFVDARRWKCNLCFRVNDLPEEFSYDPVSKTYGEPQRRPEIKSSTIEFIAPSEYMLRPPQPAVYLFLLDVSFNAVETGYLPVFCRTLMEELDHLPGDSRTQIGFITYDSVLYFYGLDPEGFQQPQMFVVSDLEEVLLPTPDSLLVNLHEAKEMIVDFLTKLPNFFEKNLQTGSALGPALQAAYKLMSPTGGRITVVQTQLPTVGAGALKSREDSDERSGKKIQHLLPATDFYKKLSLDCSAQQIAVDLFMLNSQFADIATIAGISKYSGGNTYYFPGFHTISNVAEAERFESAVRRYLTRKIGFESVMRIRCTKGLSIHTFHGNFFVRSTDLLSLPNINPDAGFGVQVSIEDNLDVNYVSFQAALLYTSSKAERRIRVHTLCLPVTTVIGEICASANQQVIVGLLTKMAVDKTLSASLADAREAMINAVVDMLASYRATLSNPSQFAGQLPCPYRLRLVPLYVLSMLKSTAFRIGASTKLDDRIFAMEQCKNMPLRYLIQMLHPDLYPVHALDDKDAIYREDRVIPQPPLLPLSSAHIDRHGAYLMDAGSYMYLWLGAAISDQFCQDVLDCQCFQRIPEAMGKLPSLENPTLDRLTEFICYLNEQRPYNAPLIIMREDSRMRGLFLQHLIEDRSESTLSYHEFLTHIQKEIKS